MKALSAVPAEQRTPNMLQAIEVGVDFLLGRDLAKADYPCTERVNSSWFAFSFPLSFRSDVLETMLVLTSLGHGDDPRLADAREFIWSKCDDRGRWTMEKSLNGKMWVDIEVKGEPSKWITLRALLALGFGRVDSSAVDTSA